MKSSTTESNTNTKPVEIQVVLQQQGNSQRDLIPNVIVDQIIPIDQESRVDGPEEEEKEQE